MRAKVAVSKFQIVVAADAVFTLATFRFPTFFQDVEAESGSGINSSVEESFVEVRARLEELSVMSLNTFSPRQRNIVQKELDAARLRHEST